MANRFDRENSINSGGRSYRVISVIVFIIIAVIFVTGVDSFGESTTDRQQETLENAIARDVVQCYALEGFYPPSLEYMEDRYGLTYDKDMFFVDYQPIAQNLYPDYTVILRK